MSLTFMFVTILNIHIPDVTFVIGSNCREPESNIPSWNAMLSYTDTDIDRLFLWMVACDRAGHSALTTLVHIKDIDSKQKARQQVKSLKVGSRTTMSDTRYIKKRKGK